MLAYCEQRVYTESLAARNEKQALLDMGSHESVGVKIQYYTRLPIMFYWMHCNKCAPSCKRAGFRWPFCVIYCITVICVITRGSNFCSVRVEHCSYTTHACQTT